MCLYPNLIQNPKYKKNKKNGGNVPTPQDNRVLLVPIGCGKCFECMKQKKRNWQIRLMEEIKCHKIMHYVTMTFSEESIIELLPDIELTNENKDIDNAIATLAMRRFLERWRKKYRKSLRHWMVTELGHENTERIHLHGIIFGGEKSEIERIWKYGHVKFGNYVNLKTINYIVKYINKIDLDHKGYVSKILTSAGIGSNYINRDDKRLNVYVGKNTDTTYKSNNGYKMAQPIYYRNKIWNEEERELLWLHMLDKNERYIMGDKIDISNGDEDYYAILEEAREKNKRLGYGDDSKNWSKEEYQKKRTAFHAKRNFVINKIKKLNKVNKITNTENNEIHLQPITRDWKETTF